MGYNKIRIAGNLFGYKRRNGIYFYVIITIKKQNEITSCYLNLSLIHISLTPKYDTQAELFDLWEKQLKETVETLANDVTIDGIKVTQQSLGSQDIIYQGDQTKWLKFANSLRLKLAGRLINEDKNRALNIVRDAAKYPITVSYTHLDVYKRQLLYMYHFVV